MTPRQVHALRARHLEQQQREEWLVGIVAATTANYSMGAPKQPLHPNDFMLHKYPVAPPRPVTGEDVMAAFAGCSKITL